MMERYADPPTKGASTTVAVKGHPLHPMLVTFPIAFLIAAPISDVAFLHTGDPFWARMSFWLLAAGTGMGCVAGLAGTVELLAVRGIRRHAAGWSHFIAAVMLLAVGFANWLPRLDDPAAAVWPSPEALPRCPKMLPQ